MPGSAAALRGLSVAPQEGKHGGDRREQQRDATDERGVTGVAYELVVSASAGPRPQCDRSDDRAARQLAVSDLVAPRLELLEARCRPDVEAGEEDRAGD